MYLLQGHVFGRCPFWYFCRGFRETNERLCCHAGTAHHTSFRCQNFQWTHIIWEELRQTLNRRKNSFRIRISPSDSPQHWGSASWLASFFSSLAPSFGLQPLLLTFISVKLFLIGLSSGTCLSCWTWAARWFQPRSLLLLVAFTRVNLPSLPPSITPDESSKIKQDIDIFKFWCLSWFRLTDC